MNSDCEPLLSGGMATDTSFQTAAEQTVCDLDGFCLLVSFGVFLHNLSNIKTSLSRWVLIRLWMVENRGDYRRSVFVFKWM